MKFELGHWMLLPGVDAIYPVSVQNVKTEDGALVVTGYSQQGRSRGELLGGSTITARFSSPMPDVIRIQLTHFKGKQPKGPMFDFDHAKVNAQAEAGQDEEKAWLRAGRLEVHVTKRLGASGFVPWGFTFFRDGATLTGSGEHGVGLFRKDGETYLRERLGLVAGETVYGLGEHFGPFVKNGQSLDTWNEDAGTDSEWAYKNVPFYLTSRGYGLLVDCTGRVSFEVASCQTTSTQFSVPGHSLDYYIFAGPTPKAALEQYTALTGRPALPPEWSFGLWLSTSFTTNYDEKSILTYIERMEAEGIPVSVFHFDCFWMRGLTWTSLLWDERNFPDPEGMLRRIKQRGVRVCVWINPYIAEASPLFSEGAAQGFLLKTPEGDIYQTDDWQPGLAFVDFTNPAACNWYTAKLKSLLAMGVDCFKTDFGERIPTAVRYFDGSDPEGMHNFYTYLYNRTVFDAIRAGKGEGEAVVFARSATAGSQRFPVHWGGDNSSTYPSMAETLRGGLSFGCSGFGFWSHDISGFIGTATPDLYKRWVAFGLLSSHSRLHGNDSPRVPWNFDDEAVAVLRHFVALKKRLMPYLMDVAKEAQEHGWPMMRAMLLEFPEDPACRSLDMQYMLGSALLVAPVFTETGEVDYYLPAGTWNHMLTGEQATGPGWRREKYDYFSLPLWVNVERGSKWQCLSSITSI